MVVQPGLCGALSEITKTGLLTTRLNYIALILDTAGFNMPKHYQSPFPAESLRQDHQPPLIPLKVMTVNQIAHSWFLCDLYRDMKMV